MKDNARIADDPLPAVSLREYGDILHRRRGIILQAFVLILVVGVVVTLMSAPTYRATARMLVEAPSYNLNTIDTANPLSELLVATQQHSVETQVELLQSEGVRKLASQKLGAALPSLSVSAVKDTEIIEAIAEGPDPKIVAAAANALLQTYIDDVADVSGREIRNARAFTERGAERARRELETTEAALRDFKQRHKVAELDKNRDTQMNAVETLNTRYRETQAGLAALRAQIASAGARLAREPKTRSGIVSAAADPSVQTTEAQVVTLEAQRAGLLEKYQPVNIHVAQVDAQIATLRKRLAQQRASVAARTEQANPAYTALQDRLVSLEIQASGLAAEAAATAGRLAEAQARLGSFPAWEVDLARLQRRLETARDNYQTFSSKQEDLRLREKTQRKTARIIERAETPAQPIRPRKFQSIVFAGFLGLFFGLCLALLQEFLDDRINSADEADRVLRLPNLGHIPAIQEEGLRLIRDLEAFSPIAESYRGLRTNLTFAAVDNPVRTLVVTSSGPGDGKSTTAANLAVAMAMDGKRVIVVDADLRRPTLHRLFSVAPSPGLTDLLVGTHTLGEVIQPTRMDHVTLIPAGSVPPNPAELLGSEAMAHFVDAVRTMADIILFDAPPTLAVADAVLLSARVDGVLFVIGFGETKKTSARQALELLGRARAHVLGTVLNKIDAGRGGYGAYYYAPGYASPPGVAARNGAKSRPEHGANGALPEITLEMTRRLPVQTADEREDPR